MADALRDLVVSLSLNTENFTRNIRSVNKQIKEAESYFKLAAAGIDGFDSSADGLSTKLSTLERKLKLQKDVVGQYERALEQASNKLKEYYARQQDYAQRLADAKSAHAQLTTELQKAAGEYAALKAQLGETDAATVAAEQNLDALNIAYAESTANVTKLAGQNDALEKATQNAADAVSTQQTQLNRASAAVRETEAAINTCNQELALAQTQWAAAGEKIRGAEIAITSIGKSMKLAESEFKLATVDIKDIEQSATGLQAQLDTLTSEWYLQQQAVTQYQTALEGAKEQLAAAQSVNDPEKIRQATDAVTEAQTALNQAQTALAQTEQQIQSTDNALNLANTNWYAAQASIDASNAALVSIGQSMQQAEAEFALAAVDIRNIEQSTTGLTAQLDMLTSKWYAQQQAVDEYRNVLQMAKEQLDAANEANDPEKIQQATDAVTDAQLALTQAQTALAQTEQQIQTTDNALNLANTNWYAAQASIDASNAALVAIGQSMQQAEAEFALAAVDIRNIEQSTTGLTAQLDMLTAKWYAQQQAVEEYKNVLQMAKEQLDAANEANDPEKIGQATQAVNDAQLALTQAQTALAQTEQQIQSTDNALNLANTNWYAAQASIDASNAALVAIGQSMQRAEAEFSLATVDIRNIEQSTTGLTAQLDMLTAKWYAQQQAVDEYRNVLQMAKEQLDAANEANDPEKIGQATQAVNDAQLALTHAQTALAQTEQQIQSTDNALNLASTNWYAAQASIDASNAALVAIGQSMQQAEAEFALAAVDIRNIEQSTTGLTAQLDMLTAKWYAQQQAVEEYKNVLQMAKEQLDAANEANDPEKIQQATDAVTDAQLALTQAQTALAQTEQQIQSTDNALNLANTNWYAAQTSIDASNTALVAIGQSMQRAEAEFSLATVDIRNIEQSTTGLTAQLDMLTSKWYAQQQAVDEYKNVLRMAKEQLDAANEANDPEKIGQATQAVNDAQLALTQAQTALAQTEQEIQSTNNALNLAETNWYAAQQAVDDANRAVTSIGKQIQIAENHFRAATANVEDMDTSVYGLSEKLSFLNTKMELQNEVVAKYEDALASAKVQLEAANEAHDPERIEEATQAVEDAQVALSGAQAELAGTSAELKNTNAQLKTAQSAWTELGNAMEATSEYFEGVSGATQSIGSTLSTVATAPVAALAAASVKASLDFESSFASVRKTVAGTEEDFAMLAQTSKQMSTEIASSASTINEVIATGGQLGIQTEHLAEFTRVMIDLGNSCEDLNADEAATSLAKFANIMGTDQSLFSNVGSTLVALGNNFATTEKPIMEMAQRLAGAGKQVGLTEAQVLGFATALSSVGIEAQMGGSALSKALINMEVAAVNGGESLTDFAAVCGLTEQQFVQLWNIDAASVFQMFIEGLARMDDEGISAIATLSEIGINEIRLRDTLLRSVNATELFSSAQAMANRAWDDNIALSTEAGKRYATTESKLTNLKNKASLFTQQLGDDLNPTIRKLIDGASDLLDQIMGLDSAQRMQLIQGAAMVASIGPLFLGISKVSKGISLAAGAFGKFALAVGTAGGGFTGFLKVLASSPSVWLAIAAAATVGTIALADYASGAKQAREAMEGMEKTAEAWKNHSAETLYNQREGLSFFGMSAEQFKDDSTKVAAQKWYEGLLSVWTDGKKESNEIVKEWTDSFKAGTTDVRDALTTMKATAGEKGYTSLAEQMQTDIDSLDAMDKEISDLLQKRQNGYFSESDKVRLQELIDTREAIRVKYNLVPEGEEGAGFDTIRKKLEAEIARAQAKGQDDASITVYENAVLAAAQGMAAMNDQINESYDAEYALIQMMTDEAERTAALTALNERYNSERRAAALEYAQILSETITPVWEKESVQQAKTDISDLIKLMTQYSAASETDKPAILAQMDELSKGMNEDALIEYYGILTQIQTLLDSGMSQSEVEDLFPEIDFSEGMQQIASIQQFLSGSGKGLTGLASIFGDAVPEEMITFATDLNLEGAQARWSEFAANPGAITTEAIIAGYALAEAAEAQQLHVIAFIDKYVEKPEGADKSSLTPTGIIAYVGKYAEVTGMSVDISALNPTNVTALVSAYKEIAEGADISTLKPSEITAQVYKYLEKEGVDASGLNPDTVTAFVMAYEEVTGGALTTSLTPTDIAATVVKYMEAENIDISALNPDQLDAIVSAYAEATNCDKTALRAEVVAQITAYEDAQGVVKPNYIQSQIAITGYDLVAYRRFVADNPVEVEGTVRLGETYENPADVLNDPNAKFYEDGVEIPVTSVPTEKLDASTLAVLDKDGTLHIMITPEYTGTQEAVEKTRSAVVEESKTTTLGLGIGLLPNTTMDYIDSAMRRIESYQKTLDYNAWDKFWASVFGENTNLGVLDSSMTADFGPERLGELTAYVGEVGTALMNGTEVSEEDISTLEKIIALVTELENLGIGGNVTGGLSSTLQGMGLMGDTETLAASMQRLIDEAKVIGGDVAGGVNAGMTEADMSPGAAAVADNTVAQLREKAQTHSPSERTKPIGKDIAAGVGAGMKEYSLEDAAAVVALNATTAMSAAMSSDILRSIGSNMMRGLVAGINAGRSSVVSAMRRAANEAVTAAKTALVIESPSKVFRDEIGVMVMKGFGEGILAESKEQARTLSNAARYLTASAKEGAMGYIANDNRRSYTDNSAVNLTVSSMSVRDEQDIQSLAREIAALTRLQQRGKGLKGI